MTNDRKTLIDYVAIKLQECKDALLECYNDEDAQQHNFQLSRRQIDADLCGINMTKLHRAECNITSAIEELEGIE